MLSTFDLLKKYDVPGPRYTSYPTVPIWDLQVQGADYSASLNQVQGDEPLSLYFHLPFCQKLCHFCGCMQAITKDQSRSAPYTEVLLKEIESVASALKHSNKKCSQIHFGGGTPNFFKPDEISQIMQCVRDQFEVLADAEIAIELHPKTNTEKFCDMLAEQGFNRISLGVQDFDENVQRLINRFQSYDETKNMVSYLRSLGFDHFNFDLIYGLPGQKNHARFTDTLHKTLELHPNRLAFYSYAHVPWVRPIQRAFKDSDIPSPEEKIKYFESAIAFFTKHKYHLIGIDHFAEESDELYQALQNKSIHRNFMGYTTRSDAHQIGMGVSSISYVNGNYFQNVKTIPEYMRAIQEQGLTSLRGCLLTEDDKIRRAWITAIMCHREIDFKEFEAAHKINVNSYFKNDFGLLDEFIKDELLELSADHLKILPQGYLVIRNIAMCFDQHLDAIKKNARNPVFSRTV